MAPFYHPTNKTYPNIIEILNISVKFQMKYSIRGEISIFNIKFADITSFNPQSVCFSKYVIKHANTFDLGDFYFFYLFLSFSFSYTTSRPSECIIMEYNPRSFNGRSHHPLNYKIEFLTSSPLQDQTFKPPPLPPQMVLQPGLLQQHLFLIYFR